MKTSQTIDPSEKRLVDHFTLAAVLSVSPERVKALHREGILPAYRAGKIALRFDVEECLALLRVEGRGSDTEPSTPGGAS